MNPEMKFKQYQPDYSGMQVRELPFCEMEDAAGRRQEYRLDVISREGNAVPSPVVFFVHGGGLLPPCDKRQTYISFFAQELTKAGYLVIAPDYPLFADEAQRQAAGSSAERCRLPAEAVHKAVEYVRSHAQELGADVERMVAIGGSAGGWTCFYAISRYPGDFKAFGNFWGVPAELPDLAHFPPVYSIHGTADALVPYALEEPLQQQLEMLGIPHRLATLEGKGHTPIPDALARMPEVLAFFDEALGAGAQR